MGKVIMIDLSERLVSEFPWTDEDRKRTLGGKVMAADILYHHVKPGMTAFDDDNWIVISTGPLTGTGAPSSARFNISTISPLTGLITSSNSGGDFGLMMKRCGYDACIITGKSEYPVHVEISNKGIEFHDASELWGLNCGETEEKLPKGSGNLVIGPAGENKVLYAAVISGERAHGRGGIGAVFGSKKLKAVTAKGFQHPVVHDEVKFRKLTRKWCKLMRGHALTGNQVPRLGTAGLVSPMQARKILATKNFSGGQYVDFDKVSGETMAEKRVLRKDGCTTCPIQCTRRYKMDDKVIKGPELEILGLMGPNIMNDDLDAIARWNYLMDEYGMDTISTAGSIAFAMELNEKGYWNSTLEFGKTDNIEDMLYKIAHRIDEGDEIANGSYRMSQKFGGEEFAIQVKGMELSAYEPRASFGQGLGYAVSNRGGCHLNAGYLVFVEGLGLDVNGLTPSGKASLCIMFQNLMEAVSAAGSCLFTTYAVIPTILIDKPNNPIIRFINGAFPYLGPVFYLINHLYMVAQLNVPIVIPHSSAVKFATGMNFTLGKMFRIGDIGWNTERAANVILGQRKGADKLPKRLTDEPSPDTGKTVPLAQMLREFYFDRGWIEGIPTAIRLLTLGIDLPDPEWYPYPTVSGKIMGTLMKGIKGVLNRG